MPSAATIASVDDPINRSILKISEDQIKGFVERPFAEISEKSGIDIETVIDRIRTMLEAGTIRRVRQTLITTSLAPGALVAWVVPNEKLNPAFDWMMENDPFTGHVVIRTTDSETAGSAYRLWTTLKVPQGYSLEKHTELIAGHIGAERVKLLPAKKVFALGVGHMRRRDVEPGARTDEPGRVLNTEIVPLGGDDWRVLEALKREFEPSELQPEPWRPRAEEAGMAYEDFIAAAKELDEKGVVGRFSTFLEHVKKPTGGAAVTRYNALFHWTVPAGSEMEAGREVGRHICMTHAYWREGGPEFNNVNLMGVAHSTEKDVVLANKAAIDQHLEEAGIPVGYTNIFWGGRSEVRPSEIMPSAYAKWCEQMGVDPESMKA